MAKPVCREGCVGGLVWRGGASGGTMLAVRASRISTSVNSMMIPVSIDLAIPPALNAVSALATILCYKRDRWDRPSHRLGVGHNIVLEDRPLG